MKFFIYITILVFFSNGLHAQSSNNQDSTSGNPTNKQIVLRKVDTTKFLRIEIESEFPGGAPAWQRFLGANLVYPKKAIRKKIQGTVLLQFIVDKDGSISDLKALSGDPLLIQAALEAMQNSPRWHPAVQRGKQVKSYKKQPIVFRLEP
jgi:TonB family protein